MYYIGELKQAAVEFSKLLAGSDMQPALKADIAKKLEKVEDDVNTREDDEKDQEIENPPLDDIEIEDLKEPCMQWARR